MFYQRSKTIRSMAPEVVLCIRTIAFFILLLLPLPIVTSLWNGVSFEQVISTTTPLRLGVMVALLLLSGYCLFGLRARYPNSRYVVTGLLGVLLIVLSLAATGAWMERSTLLSSGVRVFVMLAVIGVSLFIAMWFLVLGKKESQYFSAIDEAEMVALNASIAPKRVVWSRMWTAIFALSGMTNILVIAYEHYQVGESVLVKPLIIPAILLALHVALTLMQQRGNAAAQTTMVFYYAIVACLIGFAAYGSWMDGYMLKGVGLGVATGVALLMSILMSYESRWFSH